jgi:hypothetical protein
VCINSHVRAQLDNFEAFATNLHLCPTRLAKIVPDIPSGIGAVDAAKPGMGGIWFIDGAPPLLWRAPFPLHIKDSCLITDHNPCGNLLISDLELASIIAHQFILAQSINARKHTFIILNKNSPAISRASKGSITYCKDAYELAVLTPSPLQHAVVDIAYIAFFYLNRPHDYDKTTSSNFLSAPFRLCDIVFSM